MKILKSKTAAVTGAASGIGRMLAVNLANEGCNLALADINASGLQETAKLIGDRVKVTTHIVDVSRREQVFQYADEAAGRHGGVDLIINNAGVAVGDFLETIPLEDFEWLMGINFWGVVYGTMPNPNNGPYCAAKFAVKGYTETLAQEMHGTSISVSCVHPGGIKTNIARNARVNRTMFDLTREKGENIYEDVVFRTTADAAAKIIISGIRRNKRRILVGLDAKALDLLTRFFPVTAVTLSNVFSRRTAQKYANK